ncbi:hypothetical protein NLJ89_g9492 [Agrocybe chaxingu]|uniref:Uncharacterized protein n=1 Tax=Agrocybe chaxingu TaxID=84603 RepID=A0A9W8JTG6_9AGAR|nr:hypothetical protein NLJ89_g9492 [Agrocybe chaxingu]
MGPALKRRIIDVSDEELTTLGFLGPNVAPGVEAMIRKVKANPTHLGNTTCFVADCLRRKYPVRASPHDATEPLGSPTFPTSPTVSEADIVYSLLSNNSHALTAPSPADPPKLMYRSDLETNPFPTPTPGARFFKVPTKTAHGVFGTRLNTVWHTVAPLILQAIKAHGLQYSALMGYRFSTLEDGQEQETFGPVVVWIAVRPNTTKAGAVRDATPDILGILAHRRRG